ncbi:MAG: cation diffusion facilitator family transporter, partial [Endomicrobiia bacterium]
MRKKTKGFSEIFLIKFVTVINLMFAVGGFYFAMISRSQSVLFDSIYSFTSSFFMLMSLYVVRLIKKGEDKNYHFGYGSFEPLFIVIQTMFILTMNFVLAYFAVKTLISGGAHIGVNAAMIYTAISVVVCALVYVVLKSASKKYGSPVLSAEAKSWLNDTMLSIAVLMAFLGIIFLSGTYLSFIVPYIDSGMTLLFILFLVPQFGRQLWVNILELLTSAPSVDIQKELDAVIEPFIEKHYLAGFNAYSTKRGRTLYVVVHVYLNENRTVKTIDRIRKEMIRA